jgi:hypothetical protein
MGFVMYRRSVLGLLAAAAAGLVAGLFFSGLWPKTPLHAMATDRQGALIMATGALDDQIEAIFVLDAVTCDLKAGVLSKLGKFQAYFERNLRSDFKLGADAKPNFTLITGQADLRPPGQQNVQPSRAVVYVGETTTGKIATYAVPWSRQRLLPSQTVAGKFLPLDVWQYRQAVE